jgi:hypothetical protein
MVDIGGQLFIEMCMISVDLVMHVKEQEDWQLKILQSQFIATLTLGSRLGKGVAKLWAKRKLGSHITCSQDCRKM